MDTVTNSEHRVKGPGAGPPTWAVEILERLDAIEAAFKTRDLPALLSVEETADALHVSRSTVENLMAEGKLRSTKVKRRRLILASSVAAYLRRGLDA